MKLAVLALIPGLLAYFFASRASLSEEGALERPWISKEQSEGQPDADRPEPRAAPSEPALPGAPTQRALPPGLAIGKPTELPIRGDRSLRVTHAANGENRALVYLQGMCGNPRGADAWADLASAHASVITVRADVKCPDRPGFKWPQDIQAIQARIDAALSAVREARGGQLETDEIAIFGYSQGAHRAERLAAASPRRYRRVVLGGPPTSPTPERLRHAQVVAVLGGELEDTTHMMDGYLDLLQADINAKFFLLPRAGHGSYGPEGRRVAGEVLDFLFVSQPRP